MPENRAHKVTQEAGTIWRNPARARGIIGRTSTDARDGIGMTLWKKTLLVLLVLALSTGSALAAKAWFGFGTGVQTDGFFLNPKLKQVRITTVAPGSPAQQAGLQPNDEIVSLNGQAVAGRPALGMMHTMDSFKPGDRLTVVVKRGDAQKTLVLVAGSK